MLHKISSNIKKKGISVAALISTPVKLMASWVKCFRVTRLDI